MHTVQVIIPDLDADEPREAAKLFLSALVNADWSATGLEVCAASHTGGVEIVTLNADEIADALKPLSFDATALSDSDLTECLYEMRNRGASVAYYDADELATMFDDGREWAEFMDQERAALEEYMCDAARDYANRNGPEKE